MLFQTFAILAIAPVYTFGLPAPQIDLVRRDEDSSDLLKQLLPGGKGLKIWSTAVGIVDGAVPLTLNALKPSVNDKKAPPLFNDKEAPSNNTLGVEFKKGSWTYKGPQPSGLNVYAEPLDLSKAREVTFSYEIWFPKKFQFVKGGKLPGLYGGDDPKVAKSCSGGRRATNCFSARFMWRKGGKGELYTYLPDPKFGEKFAKNKNLCKKVKHSDCNSVYGASIGRGLFKFKTEKWTAIAVTLRLNSKGKADGVLKVTANGKEVFSVDELTFADSDKARIVGLQMQAFFGGNALAHDTCYYGVDRF